jgi:hypothetical protein
MDIRHRLHPSIGLLHCLALHCRPPRSRIAPAAVVAAAILACGAPALAGPVSFGPSLSGQGWKPLTFRSLTPMGFAAEGASQLTIRGQKAVSVIWRSLDEDSWPLMAARWRWRVNSGPPATDLSRKGGDDRAIALYFLFARDAAAANAAKGAQSLTSAMWWSSGAALVYVWGGSGARNAVVASPHMGSSGKLVLRVLQRVNQELGTITVVITHNAAIAALADRVIRISSGRIVEIQRNATKATPEDISW